ncbi:type I-E CRISPR-associated protein Cse2/CasB [Micromonospora sp. HM5-17]|jgi:CRISPR system Cascade subunit CasB|uniref:type I-E CRISPR-associated protein Cse2/CasB n=1 Tax=Micromonospora sp. HM5-17 TaxID=2487710 RepID=UPI000F47A1A6|nr:type I-E CRISPR-associated protein Cse2/CasB [Micromonospora sp. HM5-17]ROT31157.1 type I-E CRISPR-associated protein Cse2/CasB [Micromonospora sp. HM5-17]
MSTTVDVDQQPAGPARKPRSRRRRDLGDHVARTVAALQARVLGTPPQPEAVSALARLRRGIGRTPGFDYTLERYLRVPEHLLGYRPPDDAEATDAEYAVHDAVTLYALHQQSRREQMHVDGRGLGQAMADLVLRAAGPEGVRRRFAALGTASTYQESVYHLRSLITMLREHQIPLDYGLLADDLVTLRGPDGRSRVQTIWGREFFRSQPSTDIDDATPDVPEEDLS